MKYVRRYLLILCALLTGLCLPSSLLGQNNNQLWSLPGSGTENDPFRIASTTDWDAFASDVNCGIDYLGKYISLTRDITVTTMVGDPTNTNAFFEGQPSMAVQSQPTEAWNLLVSVVVQEMEALSSSTEVPFKPLAEQ